MGINSQNVSEVSIDLYWSVFIDICDDLTSINCYFTGNTIDATNLYGNKNTDR